MRLQMLKVKDGRGENSKERGLANRAMIRKYFKKNPGSTKKACSENLGLSQKTVSDHVKAIQKEG